MKKILYLILFSVFFSVSAMAEVITQWLSNAVLPGENTRLFIILTDGQRAVPGALPRVKGANLRWAEPKAIYWPGSPRQTAYLLAVDITADAPGVIDIPSISLTTNTGNTIITQPQKLTVYPFDAVVWKDIKVDKSEFLYGILWHVGNKNPYVNEPVPTELKIYAPNAFTKYSLPQLTTSNLASWRFEPALMELEGSPQGTALCKGGMKRVITFKSMIFPLKAGLVSASGGIEVNVIAGSYVDPVWGMTVNNEVPLKLDIPELKIEAKPLPPGAPADFNNAVGDFTISAKTDARDLSANDPVSVTITVTGTGNINMISCPTLADEKDWKLYPANKLNPDQNLRSISGTVQFQQLLRPIAQTAAIPSFKMTFFDPKTETYKMVTTNPIPLPWKASAALTGNSVNNTVLEPPAAGSIPIAKMTDIYAPIPDAALGQLHTPTKTGWFTLAYIPGICLLGYAFIQQVRRNRQRSLASRQRMKSFASLKSAMNDSNTQFLRQAGAYIETYIAPQYQDHEIKQILQKRDELAFTPSSDDSSLSPQEKDSMLHAIKKIVNKLPLVLLPLICLLMTLSQSSQAQSGMEYYQSGEYGKSIESYQQELNTSVSSVTQANLFYNIGDAYYRLNEPGLAALNYRKALNIVPSFTEAQCNLDFIERKEGAVLPALSIENQWITYIHHRHIVPIIILSSACVLLFIGILIVYRKRLLLWISLSVISGLIMIASIINYSIYPMTPSNLNQNQLLVITKATPAYTSADIRSAPVMTLPASTPLIYKAKIGSWYYAETFTNTPAWIPISSAQMVQ